MCLRIGELITPLSTPITPIIFSIGFAIPLFMHFGLYREIFRYSEMNAMKIAAVSLLIYSILFSSVFGVIGIIGVPKTIGILQPILLFMLIVLSRLFIVAWLGDNLTRGFKKNISARILIYGAGDTGRKLAIALKSNKEMIILGFIDEDDNLKGHTLNGWPIYHPKDLDFVITKLSISDVLLALPSQSRTHRNKIIDSLRSHKIAVRTIPDVIEIATGRVGLTEIKELEVDDLLGREPVEPNEELLTFTTKNKIVLVTGAGGSIGSELCRQILRTFPTKILLIELNEFSLYKIHEELKSIAAQMDLNTSIELIPLLGSSYDEMFMKEIIDLWRPNTIYHAAAYKHVPMVEFNIASGVKNNVWSTLICAELAIKYSVENFVLVSTDKAVRPVNIMGASKRLSEIILLALSNREKDNESKTCFSIVRFGNVLDSSGSVVPLFKQQIKDGGPVTLTHRHITRYFMTIPEAAQLVMQAAAMGAGGDIFLLDMGQPISIHDLAQRMIELSGFTVKDESRLDGDIEILITGLRPGEKLYEELLIEGDATPTPHTQIFRASENLTEWGELKPKLEKLRLATDKNDSKEIINNFLEIIKEYSPNSMMADLLEVERKKIAPNSQNL